MEAADLADEIQFTDYGRGGDLFAGTYAVVEFAATPGGLYDCAFAGELFGLLAEFDTIGDVPLRFDDVPNHVDSAACRDAADGVKVERIAAQ